MHPHTLRPFRNQEVIVWLDTGEVMAGTLVELCDPLHDLFRVLPAPGVAHTVSGEQTTDMRADWIAKIERLDLP
jgi:hypothetical protein